MRRYVVLLAVFLVTASADRASLDCPLRQLGLDYAASLQPFRSAAAFQEIADALNGAIEAVNCSVKPAAVSSSSSSSRVAWAPLPSESDVSTIWCDPTDNGSDSTADGSQHRPFQTIHRALTEVQQRRADQNLTPEKSPFAVVLRAGVFHLNTTIHMDSSMGFVSFQSFPGEKAVVSGAVPLRDAKWEPVTPPPRDAYETKRGCLATQFDAAAPGVFNEPAARSMCNQLDTCAGFVIDAKTQMVSFKTEIFWAAGSCGTVHIKNFGYTDKAAPNLFAADLSQSGIAAAIEGLRVNGQRQIRARYPNSRTVEQMDAMQVLADGWQHQPMAKTAASYYNPAFPARMNTAGGYFNTFKLGIGGPCAQRFTPQASYWCSNTSQGGGPGPYSAPVGFTLSNANESLPHISSYGSINDAKGAIVHSWRAGRWFSWAFEVDSAGYDSNGKATFGFSLERGGNQGSRGGDAGQEFMIENILDELDAPGEFFFDPLTSKLYLWHNVTTDSSTPPPNTGQVCATQLSVLFNISGASQATPIQNVSFHGITFRDTALTYMDPHGTPSGGDWAVTRAGALYFENTENVLISKNLFTTLDGHGVFLSGYARGAVIDQNEFVNIGESAINQWGYTDGSPIKGMGWDARGGNQPRGTRVTYNLVHEVGQWTKQNSFYFQSESFGNHIEGNIAYNGPRAGINFDDGLGGGSTVTRNVLFNFCRESSDHGPFNSWDRVVYLYDGDDDHTKNGTVLKKNDTISFNWMLANYHSSMAIDNDDGSCFYDTHSNVFIAEPSGAAYGGNSLKSDFGGHSNYHHGNLDLFFDKGYGISGQIAGYEDGYYDNYLYMSSDGAYGSGSPIVRGNTIWSPTGNVTENGKPLKEFQKADPKNNDPGTVAAAHPEDTVVLNVARKILKMA